MPTTREVFEAIYRQAVWGKGAARAGGSGPGSRLGATQPYRMLLQQALKANQIRSVVDAGCGDWEFSQTIDWSGIEYKGFDIVEFVIAQNNEKHAGPNIQFFAGNIVELDLPPADLLICKHVLQHLPTRDVQQFLFQAHKYKHVLLTNSVDPKTLSAPNADIAAGGYRTLDPTAPPFHLEGVKLMTYWDGFHMQQIVYVAGKP
jgi:SAM-dependent methyltransferase